MLVGVTGGIACYKTATLVSRLVQGGAAVRVAMTEPATHFVGPMTFQALTGTPVLTSVWNWPDQDQAQHVGVARWCQLMIIAPASADMLAKLAAGLCPDIVSLLTCALPGSTPVLLAPGMNRQMWENPITQRNCQTLQKVAGYRTVGPDEGWQACRTSGIGRMSEPDAILAAALNLLPADPA